MKKLLNYSFLLVFLFSLGGCSMCWNGQCALDGPYGQPGPASFQDSHDQISSGHTTETVPAT